MGIVVCLVGPSGVGKSSYLKRLQDTFGFRAPCIATTRAKRADDGEHYSYVTDSAFAEMVARDEFLEHDTYNGCRYGTMLQSVDEICRSGPGVVLDLTPNGCRQVALHLSNCVTVALLPDDKQWLRKRLCERGTNSSQEIEARSQLLDLYIAEVLQLNAPVVYCNYEPSSWDRTFAQIAEIISQKIKAPA